MTNNDIDSLRDILTNTGFVIVDNRAIHKATNLIITEKEAKRIILELEALIAQERIAARKDELRLIAEETGLFTKRRNRAVYQVYLKISYLKNRAAQLTHTVGEKNE